MLISSSQGWQFRTEAALEELVWRNLPKLLKLRPLARQFQISGKFCDIVAVEGLNRLVVVELKNTEDRYVVQQLVRYYDAISTAAALPFDMDIEAPPRLIAIAPGFHADTLIDCKYSTLPIELVTFQIEPTASALNLVLNNAAGGKLSSVQIQKGLDVPQPDIEIADPPRKLLNWLTHSPQAEFDWAMKMRHQLLGFDARMKEIVEPQRIIYGKGKSKPCCELRKVGSSGYVGRSLTYFLWLPDPENKPQVLRMMMNFNTTQKQVSQFLYSPASYKTRTSWHFPKCVENMQCFGYRRALDIYKPYLNTDLTISSENMVNLALQTWHSRL